MHKVNRVAAIIKPKRPFMKWANWANTISGDGIDQPYKYFQQDCTILLIPEYHTEREARAYINIIWASIFDQELRNWKVYEPVWPKDRTKKMFWLWFGVEFRSDVFDSE